MDGSFIYDRYVTGKNFIGRKTECNTLANLLSQGENVVIYEPPKTGKMSVVRQTLFQMRLSGINYEVYGLNLFNVRNIRDFLLKFGNAVARSAVSSPEEYSALVSEYLGGTHFFFDQERFAEKNEVLSMEGGPDEADMTGILTLPCRLAASKGIKAIVILEEFQNIMASEGHETLLKLMEDILKKSREESRCSFILCGSGVNAMKYIFEYQRYFHRIVERLPLYPVDDRDIAEHMVKGFLTTGKALEKGDALQAAAMFDRHLWYINHFSAICDSLTKGYVNRNIMLEALDILVAIHQPKFISIMDSLTDHQLSLLRAIVDGVTRFSTTEIIEKYGLNSSANVKRVKDALKKKEVVTFNEKDEPVILDPLFRYWVEKYYFEI